MPANVPALLPIERLSLTSLDAASPGTLLIKAADWGDAPYLALRGLQSFLRSRRKRDVVRVLVHAIDIHCVVHWW